MTDHRLAELCRQDPDRPVRIFAIFVQLGASDRCAYDFHSQRELDDFAARHRGTLELDDIYYHRAFYLAPRVTDRGEMERQMRAAAQERSARRSKFRNY